MGKKARRPALKGGRFTLYFDGACAPINPGGIATYGFVIRKDGTSVHEDKGLAAEPGTEDATNNMGEYSAFIQGMQAILNFNLLKGETELMVFGDSKLVIMQTMGSWKAKTPRTIKLRDRAQKLLDEVSRDCKVVMNWIPRNKNAEADKLSKRAIWDALDRDPSLFEKIRMPWGVHRGKNLLELPESYYRWLWQLGDGREAYIPPRPVRTR